MSHAVIFLERILNMADEETQEHPKRIQLIEKIASWDNLLEAYYLTSSEKWYKPDAMQFTKRLEENIIQLQNELLWGTYKVGRYNQFYIYEPKKRLIMGLKFRDRVVQWAIFLQVNNHFNRKMIYHSYGCRVGKGHIKAAETLQKWSSLTVRRNRNARYLKLDISKYFYRVSHEVLMGIVKREYPNDPEFVSLMNTIINCEHTAFGLPPGLTIDDVAREDMLYDVGMPVGNLTSQLFANICLNELDQYVKHELKVHFYVRYMDDMILEFDDKETSLADAHYCLDKIDAFLKERLHLSLNSKTTIGYVRDGITFVGCRVYPGWRKLTKQSSRNAQRNMMQVCKRYARGEISLFEANLSIGSYLGMLRHVKADRLKKWMFENVVLQRHRTKSDFNQKVRTKKNGKINQISQLARQSTQSQLVAQDDSSNTIGYSGSR
jgi:retron-type reverse transcriptase